MRGRILSPTLAQQSTLRSLVPGLRVPRPTAITETQDMVVLEVFVGMSFFFLHPPSGLRQNQNVGLGDFRPPHDSIRPCASISFPFLSWLERRARSRGLLFLSPRFPLSGCLPSLRFALPGAHVERPSTRQPFPTRPPLTENKTLLDSVLDDESGH